MKPTPWYRVPEAWLVVLLLAGGVFAGLSVAFIAMHLPDAHIAETNAPDGTVGR